MESVSSRTFLDACKIVNLKPLSKKGTRTDPKNYHSIPLLLFISKALERYTCANYEIWLYIKTGM